LLASHDYNERSPERQPAHIAGVESERLQ